MRIWHDIPDTPSPLSGNRLRRATRRRRSRRGATLVEFAAVAPLLFFLIFVMIEFGRVTMVEQILTNASREGARRGILEQTTASDVQSIVGDYLTGTSVSGATVAVSPTHLDRIGFGEPVTVTVSVPFERISWLPSPWIFDAAELSAESVMRAERPE